MGQTVGARPCRSRIALESASRVVAAIEGLADQPFNAAMSEKTATLAESPWRPAK